MPATVIAQYRPHPGQEAALLDLVRRHEPALRAAGLVTEAPFICLRARSDGSLLEIFEWISDDSAREAHETPAVNALWEEFAAVAEFATLNSLKEASGPFPHFDRVTL